ncbi:MAG: two-component sensor histidine kinase [Paludibacteraceae bacterium]|nr:two-component sensor histidine kinase [Paludibacteraceae bacterium]MBQ4032768.1 two-component sensor histidine kinase [Paludibacteraceae bacterium]
MKRKTIIILAVFMMLSFIGLLGVQLQYSIELFHITESDFDESVKRSLYQVNKIMEEEEMLFYINEAYAKESADIKLDSDTFPLLSIESLSDKQQRAVKESIARRKVMFTELAMRWFNEAPRKSLRDRIDVAHVEELLKKELLNNAVETPFRIVFIDFEGDAFSSDSLFAMSDSLINTKGYYSQMLYTSDYNQRVNFMRVWFPEKRRYILQSIAPINLFSVVSILMLFSVLVSAIVLMVRQRRLSESKTDFMHNLTHELKTPISSISLASQMLSDDSVAKSDKMRKHLTSVISDETKRLSFQVEKVLQISLLENESSIMNFKPVDINQMVASVVENFEIKVMESKGSIESMLEAERCVAEVDELHFSNIVYNLLDNAVKYAKDNQPIRLKVRTWNKSERKNTISLSIEDNGIGIPSDQLSKVFEKFHRVPTGNIHKVRGFGLGLAYVKKMVIRHKGYITVESTPSVGTKFEITIPLKH